MRFLILAVSALIMSAPAFAGAPWTYVQASYLEADSDFSDGSGPVSNRNTGYGIEGSLGFMQRWHVQGAYGKLKGDENQGDLRYTRQKIYNIRGGLHEEITPTLDLVVDIGYTKSKNDGSDNNGAGETTYTDFRVGPRWFAAEKLELGAYIIAGRGKGSAYNIFDDYDKVKFSDIGLRADVQYYFTPAWSIGARFNLKDGDAGQQFEGDSVGLNIRWSFADRW